MKKLLLCLSFFVATRISIAQTALQYNGTNYVEVSNAMNIVLAGTNTITAEAWCYLTAYSFLPTIVGNYQSGMQFLLRVDNSRTTFYVDNGGGFRSAGGATIIPLNTWTHLAGVWDGSTIKVYINGVLDGTTINITGALAGSANTVRIGASLTSEPWNGKLDDVRIWSTARTVAEINAAMTSCIPGTTPGLLALYQFEEGSGSSVADLTGNGYNGNLVNAPLWTPGMSCSVLPVNFISIQATKNNSGVLVDWKVAAEQGIVQYEVERSADGRVFTKLGTVAATQSSIYSWLDVSALQVINYYRVKSIDISGAKKYTGIVRVLAGYENPMITVSPNPVENGEMHVQFKNKPAGIYSIQLIDASGSMLLAKVITHTGGTGTQTITLPLVTAPGIYQLKVTDPDNTVTKQKLLIRTGN